MGDSKSIGTAFEAQFKKICLLQGIAITQVFDGICRIGSGGLLPRKQMCDWIISYNGKTIFTDTKTQEAGQTFSKGHVNQDQLDKMRPHRLQDVPCGYVVYFRNEDKLVFFDVFLLDLDRRHIDEGLLLGSITDCDIKKIFTYEVILPLEKTL